MYRITFVELYQTLLFFIDFTLGVLWISFKKNVNHQKITNLWLPLIFFNIYICQEKKLISSEKSVLKRHFIGPRLTYKYAFKNKLFINVSLSLKYFNVIIKVF